jgi:hypothetical protein
MAIRDRVVLRNVGCGTFMNLERVDNHRDCFLIYRQGDCILVQGMVRSVGGEK